MRVKAIGLSLLMTFGLFGCGGPGLGSQADANYWAGKVSAGSSNDHAHDALVDNGFHPWSTGRVVYGYRDRVASSDYSDGVATQTLFDGTGHVASSEAYASPVTPFPQLAPKYP